MVGMIHDSDIRPIAFSTESGSMTRSVLHSKEQIRISSLLIRMHGECRKGLKTCWEILEFS